MKSAEKKYSSFIGDLKSSNIASNITSLNFCSEQIELLLGQIKPIDDDPIVIANLANCKSEIAKARDTNTNDLPNVYIKFGDILKSMIFDLIKNIDNIKYLKKIAIHYLDVAKLAKDDRITNLSFAIADELTE